MSYALSNRSLYAAALVSLWSSTGCSGPHKEHEVQPQTHADPSVEVPTKPAAPAAGAPAVQTPIDASAPTGEAGRAAPSGAAGHAADSGSAGSFADADAGAEPTPKTDPSMHVSAAQLASGLAAAACTALEACLGVQKLSTLTAREPCEARLAASLLQSDLALLDDSLSRKRLVLHQELLEDCYRETRALGCAIQTQRLGGACRSTLAGQVSAGGTCSIDAECTGDTFCPQDACPRSCRALAADGGACARDEECKLGLICAAGRCTEPSAAGAACAGPTRATCVFGTSCVGGTDTQAGRCVDNATLSVGELNAECAPTGPLCREGLHCAWDSSTKFRCQNGVDTGEACHVALPGQCPNESYCDAPDPMTVGHCQRLPADGQPCVLKGQCAPGSACVSEAAGAVCRRLLDLGQACSQAALCRSGRCEAGRCAAPKPCP